ncbi:hypothetical protein MRX96_027714 [Rhipicephalus microplus]
MSASPTRCYSAVLYAGTAAVKTEDDSPAGSALFRSTRFAPAEVAAYGIKVRATLPEGYKNAQKDVNKRTSKPRQCGPWDAASTTRVAFRRHAVHGEGRHDGGNGKRVRRRDFGAARYAAVVRGPRGAVRPRGLAGPMSALSSDRLRRP